MTSSPLLGSMRSVLALSFTAIPARHSHSALSVLGSWAEPPPPIGTPVILLIRSPSPYGGATPITLLQPADFSERRPSSQPRHTLITTIPPSPRLGCRCSPLGDSFMPNYSISIFSVVQKDEVLQEVGIFFFSLPPVPHLQYRMSAALQRNTRLGWGFVG